MTDGQNLMAVQNWNEVKGLEDVPSPGLLIDADRVVRNIAKMVGMVGGPEQALRLRPHVKTHKMTEVVRLQLEAGIVKFKAATLAEVEMVAQAGGRDVLFAYQPVGPNLTRLTRLVAQYPQTSFATIVDDASTVQRLATELGNTVEPFRVYIDVNCGMDRTGIPFGSELDRLRETIEATPGLTFAGLHVYDGHVHDPLLETRRQKATDIIQQVADYQRLNPAPAIIGGGSPTFCIWAQQTAWECSPGTPVFWDRGYSNGYPELEFATAVVLLTRVISRPAGNLLCLDLGYKAVAAEMPLEIRVALPQVPGAKLVKHSEEHLVVETPEAASFALGTPLLAYPKHICPTVALHAYATIVRNQQVTRETWRVTARDR